MGLQGQLSDLSSDSIPFLVLAMVASCVAYLRSAVLGMAHRPSLADHLTLLNHALSYTSTSASADCCAVCISTISPGDLIRRLSCRHVFHKLCLDACIAHRSLNCPLCRSPFAAALQY